MRFSKLGLFITICTTVMLAGCSTSGDGGAESQTVAVEGASSVQGSPVLYEQLLYAKTADNFTWERGDSTRTLQPGTLDHYDQLRRVAPGGFVVQETDNEYFICVSIGPKPSVSQGFRVQSLKLVDRDRETGGYPILHIEVNETTDESISDPYNGGVVVTSLIRIAKQDLPHGVAINEMIVSVHQIIGEQGITAMNGNGNHPI